MPFCTLNTIFAHLHSYCLLDFITHCLHYSLKWRPDQQTPLCQCLDFKLLLSPSRVLSLIIISLQLQPPGWSSSLSSTWLFCINLLHASPSDSDAFTSHSKPVCLQMATHSESVFVRSSCLLIGSFSSPLSPSAHSCGICRDLLFLSTLKELVVFYVKCPEITFFFFASSKVELKCKQKSVIRDSTSWEWSNPTAKTCQNQLKIHILTSSETVAETQLLHIALKMSTVRRHWTLDVIEGGQTTLLLHW